MEKNPDARVAHFKVTDVPIADVGKQNANIAGLLVAQNSGQCSIPISAQRNRLSHCTVTAKRQFLVPDAAPC